MTSGPTAADATRLGVLGWPVAHSRSPAMHNAALRAAGLHDWRYQLLPAPPELFDELVRALPGAGFRGANVTIPHKAAALALADEATPRAAAIGAANTLTFPDGAIVADNTDAPALTASLPFTVAGATALVLGAGGSARAAVWALLDAGAGEVRVWNRTPERARALVRELGTTTRPGRVLAVADAAPADLLVNCTAVGLQRPSGSRAGSDPLHDLPLHDLPLGVGQLAGYAVVADFVYTPSGTRLIDAAVARGLATVDGLELLVAQGALAFERFTGRRAPLEVMRAAARADHEPARGGG